MAYFLEEKTLDESSSMTLSDFEIFPPDALSVIDGGETTSAADITSSSIDAS